jgi:hypothetical protein
MKNVFHAAIAMSLCSTSLAGGGDLYYGGLSKDKKYSFELQDLKMGDRSDDAIPIHISITKTRHFSNEPSANPIAGCMVVVADSSPVAFVCSRSASSPAFRQVIYAFSGSSYLAKGSSFRCVSRCSGNIPSQFTLLEAASGED